MAFQQNKLPAWTHFRSRTGLNKARILDPLDDPNYYRHGSPFGAVGDGRPNLVSPVSVLSADTNRKAQPYTRFDWGVDWKGFGASKKDAETKMGKAIPRLSLLCNGREDAGSGSETQTPGSGLSGAELDQCSVCMRLNGRGEGAGLVLDKRGMRSLESAGGDSGYVRSEEEGSESSSSDSEDVGLGDVVDDKGDLREEGEFLDLEDWLSLVVHLTFERVEERV